MYDGRLPIVGYTSAKDVDRGREIGSGSRNNGVSLLLLAGVALSKSKARKGTCGALHTMMKRESLFRNGGRSVTL